jgi:hypothetical protein
MQMKQYQPSNGGVKVGQCVINKPAANSNFPETVIQQRLDEQLASNRIRIPRNTGRRLWESLTEIQINSAQNIYLGFQGRFGELGYRAQNFMWTAKYTGKPEGRLDRLIEIFSDWASHERGVRFDVISVLDLLVFGKSCRDVDKSLRKRKGFAKENLLSGLETYLDVSEMHLKRENDLTFGGQ